MMLSGIHHHNIESPTVHNVTLDHCALKLAPRIAAAPDW